MANKIDEQEKKAVSPPALHYNGQTVILWAAVVGLLGLIVGGCIGFGFGHHMGLRNAKDNISSGWMYGGMSVRGAVEPGMWQQMGSGSRLVGVVTKVSGSSFTLVGQGTTETITTNSNTVYTGSANKVSVNDSVMLTDMKSGSKYIANSIMVMNNE